MNETRAKLVQLLRGVVAGPVLVHLAETGVVEQLLTRSINPNKIEGNPSRNHAEAALDYLTSIGLTSSCGGEYSCQTS